MPKNRLLSLFTVCVLLLGILSISPVPTTQALEEERTITYNLYATDGYIEMADGAPVYTYGFVGGRDQAAISYQSTFCTFDGDDRNCLTPTNLQAVAIPPTGGPIQPGEQVFAGHAQFPAPVIYASKGDVVQIRLKNLGVNANPFAPNDPHSIHLHGLDVDAANDGVPETSVGAVPANLCFDGTTNSDCSANGGPAPGAGNVIVYMFSPTRVGTYMYHCHQEADIHVNMGMYGALVIYNRGEPASQTGPGQGAGGKLWGFTYDKDYVMLLGEMDVRGHEDEEGTYVPQSWDPNPYNWAQYKPQYWFINGLSFPQTIHAGFPSGYAYSDWLAAHPGYETLYTGSVSAGGAGWGTPGQKVLLRTINLGFETQPMHMHGYHGKILGSDQRAWTWANRVSGGVPTPFGQGLEKNTLTIGSGETYEWLVDFGQQSFQSTYPGDTQSCYDPATNLPIPNAPGCSPIPANGDPDEPNKYIGGPTVTGLEGPTPNFDFAGYGTSQYFPFHNHDDYKATNNGAYPGGMFTMLVPTP